MRDWNKRQVKQGIVLLVTCQILYVGGVIGGIYWIVTTIASALGGSG